MHTESLKGFRLVRIDYGDPWRPEYEILQRWGGYGGPDGRDTLEENIDLGHFREGDSGWLRGDYFPDGTCTYGGRRGANNVLWFAMPEAVYNETFGPKFNAWGEYAP